MTAPLQDETIVYFGPEPWEGLWRNRHQLMSRFAGRNNVWYVEPPALLHQLLRGKGFRTRLFTRDPSGVNIFHSPWWLPIIGRAPFKNVSIRIYIFVLSMVAGLGNRKPVVWYSKPEMIDYLDALPARLSIYHVVDEYSGYGTPTEDKRRKLVEKEVALLRKADLAIVVTPTLLTLKLPYNPNTHLVANAVDFSAYAECEAALPDDMKNIHGPIIGYSGLIAARLDLDLVCAAAAARPNWHYVFVGAVNDDRCHAELEHLRTLPNVHFLGQKSVSETPRYVSQFDVCMIPYVLNLRAAHAGPLKLYEYAAAAKPIVATDFPAACEFAGKIEIVTGVESFVTACERCLDSNAMATAIADNLRFAGDNTWDHRIEQVSDIIRAYS